MKWTEGIFSTIIRNDDDINGGCTILKGIERKEKKKIAEKTKKKKIWETRSEKKKLFILYLCELL